MEYFALIGTVVFVHLIAAISPGPDFVMALRNTLTYGRKAGLWTAVGFGGGIIIHVLYSFFGIAIVISQSIILFNVIKLLGAGYLLYIGYKSLTSDASYVDLEPQIEKKKIGNFGAFRIGFLTNALNPKATLFFLSLFTLVITPNIPATVIALAGGIMVLNTILWFSFVAILMSQKHILRGFQKYQKILNKTFGVLLVGLGIKIALTTK